MRGGVSLLLGIQNFLMKLVLSHGVEFKNYIAHIVSNIDK